MTVNVHLLELPATFCCLVNIYLAARANIWNWLFGIITVSLYLIIFYQVKLYADMSLQLVFLSMQFYGSYQWLFGGEQHTALQVHAMPTSAWKWLLLIGSMSAAGISWLLINYTDSTQIPLDVFIATASLIAQWMMSKKYLENWLVWIAVNIVSIYTYLLKQLYLSAGLYVILCLLCINGFIHWRKMIKQNLFS